MALYEVFLHPNCADNEFFPFHCGSVTVMYPHIKSPLFVLQNMYDNNQINSQLLMPACYGASCSEQQLQFVRYFGRAQRNSTQLMTDPPLLFPFPPLVCVCVFTVCVALRLVACVLPGVASD